MKKLVIILTLGTACLTSLFLTSCQKEETTVKTTESDLTQAETTPNDLKASDRAVSILSYGVTWDALNQGWLTPYKTDCSQVSLGTDVQIKLGGIPVREVTGISRIDMTMAKVVVTTGLTSNFPNQIMIVDVATGNVLSNVPAKLGGAIIALKDIELGYFNNVTPRYYAIQAGTRRIVSVDIFTGNCVLLATVPGAGILHGLATTNNNRVYVIQTNSAACAGLGLMWRYNVTTAAPTLAAAGNQNYIGTAAMMNGEGGLSYIFACPNNPFQFANQTGVFSNATGPVGCAPAAMLTTVFGGARRFHDTTLYQ